MKDRIKKLQSYFSQNEIADSIWVNRTVIFQESSNISLKTIEKIISTTKLTYEELKTDKLEEFIKNKIYARRYKFHTSESEKYHLLLNIK